MLGAMTDLARLLDLQAIDTTLEQLAHRHATLPERAELVRLDAEAAAATASVSEERDRRHAIARDQKRLEDEIAVLTGKIEHVDGQLYSGTLTSPKEAQALQADSESLQRRRSDLEDEVLVLMEEAEPLDERLAEVDARLEAIAAERARVTTSLGAAESVVDAELASTRATRDAEAAHIDPATLSMYDQLRRSSDGIAIARLQGSTCQGCHLSLAPAEVDAIKRRPADELVHCPDCGRLLVR